jgi:hypothetical protein
MQNNINKFRKLLKEAMYDDDRERLELYAKEGDKEAIRRLKILKKRSGEIPYTKSQDPKFLQDIAKDFTEAFRSSDYLERYYEDFHDFRLNSLRSFFEYLEREKILQYSPLCIKYLDKETQLNFLYKIVQFLEYAQDFYNGPHKDEMKKNLITAQIYYYKKHNKKYNGYILELVQLVGYDERMFDQLYINSDSYSGFRVLRQYVNTLSLDALPQEQLNKFNRLAEYYAEPNTRIPYYPDHGGYNTRER